MRKYLRKIVCDGADYSEFAVKRAYKTNILEDDGAEIDLFVSGDKGKNITSLEVIVRPFEVVTLRLEI
jgi:hypothetical protein